MERQSSDYVDRITNPKTGKYTLGHKFKEWIYRSKNILSVLAIIFGTVLTALFVSYALDLSSDVGALLIFFSAIVAILLAYAVAKNSRHSAYPEALHQNVIKIDRNSDRYKNVDDLTQAEVDRRIKKFRNKHKK